jgi:rubrerythrin
MVSDQVDGCAEVVDCGSGRDCGKTKGETMAELKGTKTERNLLEAFAGESQARNKYTYYASAAKKEGYDQVAAIFEETADNEKEHAKLHLKFLSGIGGTIENLKQAASGENAEWTEMYPRMAKEAREEGFEEIAAVFEGIGTIEKAHQERYQKLLQGIEQGTFFKKNDSVLWKCRNCGNIMEGAEAPKVCPVCKHPQGYFELLATNY